MKELDETRMMEEENWPLDEDDVSHSSPRLPWNNFFSDPYFTLLYQSPPASDRHMRQLQTLLTCVADEQKPDQERGKAAVALAEEVLGRAQTVLSLTSTDTVAAEGWLELGVKLGSASAALELSHLYLARAGFKVAMVPSRFGLPVLTDLETAPARAGRHAAFDACKPWYNGARLALRHSDNGFKDCDADDLQAMITCVLCFMMHTPGKHHMAKFVERHIPQPADCLSWLAPLWPLLAGAAVRTSRQPEHDLPRHDEQFQAAKLAMQRNVPHMNGSEIPLAIEPPRESDHLAGNAIAVLKGPIPGSTDRDEKPQLERYERQLKSVGLTPMPDAGALDRIHQTLAEEFPWAIATIQDVMAELVARKRHGVRHLGMSPLLLVGPPGSGKTRFAQRLGSLLNTPNTVVNMAGMSDVKLLKGVTRGWSNNRPSRIVEFIAQSSAANPLFVLDEIDKAGSQSVNGGDPQEALLDLLEPGNARRFQDIYLMAECDVSHCLYVATSNSLRRLPEHLLSRLRIVHFPMPEAEHSPAIVNNLLRDVEASWGLAPATLTLGPWQQAMLAGLAPRQMRLALMDMLGAGDEENARAFTLH